MIEKLAKLEAEASLLEPTPATRQHWNAQMIAYSDAFLEGIDSSKAFEISEDQGAKLLDMPIQETGYPIESILANLKENVDKPGLNPASGGHLGYIPGGGIVPTAMGDYLAAISNRYAGVFYASPGAVRMENMLIRWMCNLMGYPASALGNLTSGGSIANLIAITTARDAQGIRARDIETSVIYLTEQAHHSIQKAIRIAGLNEAKFRYISVDEQYRMDARVLEQTIEQDKKAGLRPFLIVASVGTTDVGAVDPIDTIADLSEAHDMWLHVDAAYGGFFVLVDELKSKFKGIDRSDSIAIDPHKGLFLAYGSGAVLIKNIKALHHTHRYKANYMQDVVQAVDEPSPAELSPELTKHFRGLRLWLPLLLYGVKPFRACLEEKVYLARYFYEKVQELGFEVGTYPELSVAMYRYVPAEGDANAFNMELLEAVKQDGRVFISSTTLNGVYWLRVAVLVFRTHRDTMDILLDVLAKAVKNQTKKLDGQL